jgi:hypothetical protein
MRFESDAEGLLDDDRELDEIEGVDAEIVDERGCR